MNPGSGMTNKFIFLLLLVVTALLLLKPIRCQRRLGDPCGGPAPASYDGTDIGRPYMVDNSTGTPVYTFLDVKDYHPPSNRSKRGATSYSSRLWPKGIVYYEFHSSLTSVEREKIYDAMRHWENKTCIRFRERDNKPEGGILYFRGTGCCSFVGRFAYFIQPVSIGFRCSFASTVHEIGHVLGFWHEQSRPDRDKYVNIHRENILPEFEQNFDKETAVNSLGVPYDFNSIMHYSASAFAKSNTNTISTKEKDIPFGLAPELSPLDIKQTNLLYKARCDSRSASESKSTLPPPSPPTVAPGRCNEKISGTTGTFSPPDNPYRSNTDCAWLIEVPKGYYITLTIYNIQIDGLCNTATDTHIAIHSGNYISQSPRRLCGSRSYYRVTIREQFAYITFHTNGDTNTRRRTGFTRAEFTAQDIDECRLKYCDHDCVNSIGSFNCTCRSGYYLAGTGRCFDINECGDNNGGCSHTCVNMASTYRCECPTGYTLLPNNRDCVRGVLSCQQSNGGCDHICTDTQNGAICSCRNGYQLVNDRSCTDINECVVHNGICGSDKLCNNTDGSYMCHCLTGYTLSSDGRCRDINECSTPNICGANEQCTNTPGSYRCTCKSRYVERRNGNCEDINECSDRTLCSGDNKLCVNMPGTYRCACRNGYHNVNGKCEDIDECAADVHNCKSNEQCINRHGNFICRCANGYKLVNGVCEDINECDRRNRCDQLCINTKGSYQCGCQEGYSLMDDERSCKDIDECSSSGNHKGLCPSDKTCVNTRGSYVCECKEGYKQLKNGKCEDIDECATGAHNCKSNERCINRHGHFTCRCADGYRLVNDLCEDINECSRRNRCDQLCINTEGSYQCGCLRGYSLMDDGKSCEDIDECSGRNRNRLCPSDKNCVNTRGSYVCECTEGYKQLKNGTCEDIDECSTGVHNCKSSERCINKHGHFTCKCADGYKLVNGTCEDINECDRRNRCDQLCINTEGSYKCGCLKGYSLMDDDKSCEDIDECSGRNRNRLCPSDKSCVNTRGAYVCECREGYKQLKNGTCEDIDECTTGVHKCKSNERCINRHGHFICKCADGYKLVNGTCEDINECDRRNRCDQLCINTKGSYRCGCHKGYSLMDDEKSCEDIDECSGRNGNRLCPSDKNCANTQGGYVCECREGYKQLKNGTCEDINECESDNVCQQRCFNRKGSFLCRCLRGYRLMDDERTCQDIDECADNNGGCDDICINTNGSYSCQCSDGLRLLRDKKSCGSSSANCIPGGHGCRTKCDEKNNSCCLPGLEISRNGRLCKDINECAEGTNKCGQKCVNTIGSFHCDCLPGYTLRNNQRDCKDINECRINNGGCDHMCRNTLGSFECSCNTHYMLGEDQKTCISVCGNVIIHEPTGNISSSGFPISSYPPNSNCSWTINLPEQYKSVELKVNEMSIEESVNCTKDRLIIINGKDEKSLSMGSYCGKELPPIMQSSTRAVTVYFISDDKINNKGFSLQYKGLTERVKGMYGCNITIRENYTFALSSFPSQYTSPIDCVYSLHGPTRDHKMKVTFLYLDVQDADCSRDRIEVYDGRDVIPRYKVADICNGGIRNTEFVSSGRHMRIRYIGNTLNTYLGFHASVKFVL